MAYKFAYVIFFMYLYIQSFGDEALFFFVPAFQPVDVSKYAKIKNTTLHICIFQKKVVILQAI